MHPKIDKHRQLDEEYRKKKAQEEYLKSEKYLWDYREDLVNNYLRPAKEHEYALWLRHWLLDNDITHYYNYEFPEGYFYIATRPFCLTVDLLGSSSLCVIVPSDIKVEVRKRGHCHFYYMKDFTTDARSWVPGYKNSTA